MGPLRKIARPLPAFTIVETMAALVLVSISIGTTFLLFTALLSQPNPYTVARAEIVLQNELLRLDEGGVPETRTFEAAGFTIEQHSEPRGRHAWLVRLAARTPTGEHVHSIRTLVYRPPQ
jgi:hypothetical protein